MHTFNWILGLLLAAALDVPCWHASAFGDTSCVITNPYKSRYIRAFLEHQRQPEESCISNSTTTLGQEIHVVNVRQISHSGEDEPQEVYVTVRTFNQRGKYRKPLVIVLKSDLPTTWRVETIKIRDASPTRHLFVVSKHSTILFHNFSLRQTVRNMAAIPSRSQSLIDWVDTMYGPVTAFSELNGVNALTLQVGIHEVAGLPIKCELNGGNPGRSFIRGNFREDRPITGCSSQDYSNKRKSVHIIEVSSDQNGSKSEIVVNIVPEILGSVNSHIVLLLKSPDDLTWKVKSRKVRGSIEVVGNSPIDTKEVNMDTVETRMEPLPYSGKDLVSWVADRFGPILSYSSVPDANHIRLVVPEQDEPVQDKPGQNLPPYLTSVTGTRASPFNNPSQTESAVRKSLTTVCHYGGFEVALPKTVAQAYGIKEEYLSLRSASCQAYFNSTHFILKSPTSGCNTQLTQRDQFITYKNALVIKAKTWREMKNEASEALLVGSGDGNNEYEDFSGSGAGEFSKGDNSDMTHVDDEDYQIQSLEVGVQCTLTKVHKEPMYFLDTYTDPYYQIQSGSPIMVSRDQTIYIQASLVAEPSMKLLLDECWLVSEAEGIRLLDIIHRGCLVQPGAKWHETDSGNDVLTPSSVVRFSFPLPSDFDAPRFAIGCLGLPCSQSEKQQCLDQEGYCSEQRSILPNPADKGKMAIIQGAGSFHLEMVLNKILQKIGTVNFPKPVQTETVTTQSQGNEDMPSGKVIMEGLDSGTVIGIAFAAFVIGVMLTAALWYIHAHTGPVKQGGRGWAEASGESTPCSTAPITIST